MNDDNSVDALSWRNLLSARDLSDEQRRLVALLAEGHTQAAIARQLGLHRAAVWRRVKALRSRLTQ